MTLGLPVGVRLWPGSTLTILGKVEDTAPPRNQWNLHCVYVAWFPRPLLVGTSIQSSFACAAARLSLAKTHPHGGRRLVLGTMNLFGWGKCNLYPLPAAAQGVASRLDHGGRTKGPLRLVDGRHKGFFRDLGDRNVAAAHCRRSESPPPISSRFRRPSPRWGRR